MLNLNIEFMRDEDSLCSKVEDDLEHEILKYIKKYGIEEQQKHLSELTENARIQMSGLRELLFCWYPFQKDAQILEIGGGLGALTGYLCKVAKHLVCLEKKKARAEIIRERWRGQGNLEVLNQNFLECGPTKSFDYIVVHDIIGYLNKYNQKPIMLSEALEYFRKFLVPNGILLVTVPNRQGLKYFSGSVEEYSQKLFTGLNGFDSYDSIMTYTKKEWKDSIDISGFKSSRFYYPFPDCKFPWEIYTDDIFQDINYGAESKVTETERLKLFDEARMFRNLQKQNILEHFVNTFFIEMCNGENIHSGRDILYFNSGYGNALTVNRPYVVKEKNKYRVMSCHGQDEKWKYAKSAVTLLTNACDDFLLCRKNEKGMELNRLLLRICDDVYQRLQNNRDIAYINIGMEQIFFFGDKIYIVPNQLEPELAPEPLYHIWNLLDCWYRGMKSSSQSVTRQINLDEVYRRYGITEYLVKEFIKQRNTLAKKYGNDLHTYYKNCYMIDILYPEEIILYGDKIWEGHIDKEDNLSSEMNQAVVEKRILDRQKKELTGEVKL